MLNRPATLTNFCKNVIHIFLKTLLDFYKGHGFTRAASLAYTTLLAFVPLTIMIMGLMRFFPFFDQIMKRLEAFVFTNFVPHTGKVIFYYLQEFQHHAHYLSWISFSFLGLTGFIMLLTMENHLNELWHIKRKRFVGLSFLIHWLILMLGPLLLCTSLAVSSYLFSTNWFKDYSFREVWLSLPFLASFLAYFCLYIALPSCKVKISQALLGASLAAFAFELAKSGFVYYAKFASYGILYGAIATVPLFLIWLYISSVIFLMGAQVVNTLRIRAL